MKFLLPMTEITDFRFGIITTPHWNGVPDGIKSGMEWAGDNEAFTRKFDEQRYFSWLKKMEPYRPACLFLSIPDRVGNAKATLELFDQWITRFSGWPAAFVAQDGQENLQFPDKFDVLFIGGTTRWKLSDAAISCIKRGQAAGKRIHIGRVNYWKRYHHFAGLEGSKEFTADGTRNRFDGTKKTIDAWADYMERIAQLRFPLFDCDYPGQPDSQLVGTGNDSY